MAVDQIYILQLYELVVDGGQLDEWKSSEEAKEKFRVEDPFAEYFD